MLHTDTIAAISSAVGPAARMIVRLSGPQSLQIASHLNPVLNQPVSLVRLRLRDLSFPSWLYLFRAPHSYTAEDTIEFHIPGNPLLARMLLDELTKLGARPAEPGEFTARAYFNGRLDLSQAEGVAATIAAGNEDELRAARQLLAGELAKRVKPAMESLANTLALVEVGIDFSEEDVSFLSAAEVLARLDEIDQSLDRLMRESRRFERLHHPPRFVLVGQPNAGKSTLLNTLAGEDRAVVSSIAGTTRDALSAEIALPRGMIQLIDIAGIEQNAISPDTIARQMQDRALATIEAADRVILVHDCTDQTPPLTLSRSPDLLVSTKSDLNPTAKGDLLVSARVGTNLPELRKRLDDLAFGQTHSASLAINARHIQAIQSARESISRGQTAAASPEMLAMDLRDALDSLGEILGQMTPDDVLGRIFAGFCIGK